MTPLWCSQQETGNHTASIYPAIFWSVSVKTINPKWYDTVIPVPCSRKSSTIPNNLCIKLPGTLSRISTGISLWLTIGKRKLLQLIDMGYSGIPIFGEIAQAHSILILLVFFVFITDFTGDKIHTLGIDGQLMRYMITEGGMQLPLAICIINESEMVVGECLTGTAKYLTIKLWRKRRRICQECNILTFNILNVLAFITVANIYLLIFILHNTIGTYLKVHQNNEYKRSC